MTNSNIIINSEDMPTKEALTSGASRLRKCCDLLTRYPNKKDEDVAALAAAASFLEMLSKKNWKDKR